MKINKTFTVIILLLTSTYHFCQFQKDKAFFLDFAGNNWGNAQMIPETLDFTPEGEIMVGATEWWELNNKGEENAKGNLIYLKFDNNGKFLNSFYTNEYGKYMPYASMYDKEKKRFLQMIQKPQPDDWNYTNVRFGFLQTSNNLKTWSFSSYNNTDIGSYVSPYIAKLDNDIYMIIHFTSTADAYDPTRIEFQLFSLNDNGDIKKIDDIYTPAIESSSDKSFTHLDYKNNAMQIGNHFFLYSFSRTSSSTVENLDLYFEDKILHDFYLNDTKDSLLVKKHFFTNRGYEAITPLMIYEEPFLLSSIENNEVLFIAQNRDKIRMIDIWKYKMGSATPVLYKPQIFKNSDFPIAKYRHVKRLPGKGYLLYALDPYDKQVNCVMIDDNFNYVKHETVDLPTNFKVDGYGVSTKILGSSDIENGVFKIAVSTMEDDRLLKVWVIPCKM